MSERRKRVFVSFDFDHDRVLKEFIIGQSKLPDSPFEVSDWSMKEAARQGNWEQEARTRIGQSDLVVVMLGKSTHNAHGVLKEVKIARACGKPIVQIVGYTDIDPEPVADAGRKLLWNWENLKTLFRQTDVKKVA